MRSVLETAVRQFVSGQHLRNVLQGEWVELRDEAGQPLPGIRGRMGAASVTHVGHAIGVDLIEMEPGSAFPLHVHPGDHILYIEQGPGCVQIDGINWIIQTGDTVFIPAEYPHGVRTLPRQALRFLAFGVPHKQLEATDRMRLVNDGQPPKEETTA